LALALSVIGNARQVDGKFSYDTALDYDRRAMEADPYNATVHLWAALHWGELGFIDKAIHLLRRCLEIDPAYGNCKRHLASMTLASGNEELALQLFQEGSEDGFAGNEAYFLPLVLRRQGRAAAGYVAHNLTNEPGFPVGDLLDILQFPERDHSAAQQRYRARVEEFDWRNLVSDPLIGAYYDFFERATAVIDDSSNWLWGPDLARFRQSPEFKQLIARLGQEEYWRQHGFPPMCRPLGGEDFECD
jgi:tetratricopeptide (TPR) repeat protein